MTTLHSQSVEDMKKTFFIVLTLIVEKMTTLHSQSVEDMKKTQENL